MKLYSGPLSLLSRKVEIALHEKGLPFERVMVPFSQAAGYAPKHPAVRAANAKGHVPVRVAAGIAAADRELSPPIAAAWPAARFGPLSRRT